LNTTSDDLQAMEVTVRNYNDRLQYVSEQYEKLDKKDEVLNRIKTDVDSQFEKLKDLEQRLTNCNRQAVSLPQEIKEVQNSVDRILQNGPKITDAIGRLEKLDSIIEDTDKRIETLNSVQNGIKKTQLDLEGINRDVDNKFNILQKMTQQELAKKPRAKENTINPQINETVRTLKRKGWTIAEIAENVKLTENEVDLILQLPE
jgi:predicted  nucleic acid-binding Zn-ribbon protein